MADLVLDASLAGKPEENAPRQAITIDQIQELEQSMDIFDKVSLVFLLYPDINLALQRLQAVEAHINASTKGSDLNGMCLLSDWARTPMRTTKLSSNNCDVLATDNARAFVEALAIVQDFKTLENLGCGNRDSGRIIREMSLKTPQKFCVNYVRNVFYRLCEDLHPLIAEKLIRQVEAERPDLIRSCSPNARLLEITILHWASRGYINISERMSVDVRNITRHLVILGESNLVKMLQMYLPYETYSSATEKKKKKEPLRIQEEELQSPLPQTPISEKTKSSLPLVADDQMPNIDRIEIKREQKPASVKDSVKTEEKKLYQMNENSMGVCVIINQKNFYRDRHPALRDFLPEKPLEDRLGTDVDRDRLIEAFTSLGFDVEVFSNLRHDEICREARRIASLPKLHEHSSFALCVLSHGQKDVVYGCNSIPVEIMELVEIFCGAKCPALVGKPKIFIIQACQGSKIQKTALSDIQEDGPKTLPGVKDYVKFLSTVPGYVSLRHKVTGSWFIDILCQEIIGREPNSTILDVFTQVNAAVDQKSSVVGNSVVSMMPELRSTLRGAVHLPLSSKYLRKAALHALQRAIFNRLFEEFFRKNNQMK